MRLIKLRSGSARAARGFSMIEIMVAVLVLSVGLLGLAALQSFSLRNNQSANQRTQATNLAYELADSMRGNLDQLAAYEAAFGDWTGACPDAPPATAPADCTGDNPDAVECDIARWEDRLCRTLPNGRGRIEGGFAAVAGTSAVSGEVTISICWADNREDYDAPTADCDDEDSGETRFDMRTRI